MIFVSADEAAGIDFDLAAAVQAHTAALEAHKFTVDIPAPVAHPLVEAIVKQGGEFEVEQPEPVPEPTIAEYAAEKRWQREIGGIVVNGIAVHTDDRSKLMISGARLAAQNAPEFTTTWVAADGSVHELDAAAIIAISDAVLAHVSSCFAIYAAVLAADPPMTASEIDAAFAA